MSNNRTAATVKLSFNSNSEKIAFCSRNGIMPAEIIQDGLGWMEIEDDGIAYENSPFVYQVNRDTP